MSFTTTVLGTFRSPSRALQEASEKKSIAWPLILCTAASIAFTAVLLPRWDLERSVADQLDLIPATQAMSPHEREEAIASGAKVGKIGQAVSAALGPSVSALIIAFALWLALRVAGSKPAFLPTLSVAAHALLPLALRQLLTIPALLSRGAVRLQDLGALLPSNLAAFLVERGAQLTPKVGLLTALDLFSLWSVVLLAIGMASVAKVSKQRSGAVVAVLWLSYVAVFHVAAPALALAGGKVH
jgi:hypothetical protein